MFRELRSRLILIGKGPVTTGCREVLAAIRGHRNKVLDLDVPHLGVLELGLHGHHHALREHVVRISRHDRWLVWHHAAAVRNVPAILRV